MFQIIASYLDIRFEFLRNIAFHFLSTTTNPICNGNAAFEKRHRKPFNV